MLLRSRDVPAQSADCRLRRHDHRLLIPKMPNGIDARYQAGCHILNVAFGAGELSSKEHTRVAPRCHAGQEDIGGIDVGIPMYVAQLDQLGAFQTWWPAKALIL